MNAFEVKVVIVVEGSQIVKLQGVVDFGNLAETLDSEKIPHAPGEMLIGDSESDDLCSVSFIIAGSFGLSDIQPILDAAANIIMGQLKESEAYRRAISDAARRRKDNYRNN